MISVASAQLLPVECLRSLTHHYLLYLSVISWLVTFFHSIEKNVLIKLFWVTPFIHGCWIFCLSFDDLLLSQPCHCCWSALPEQRGSESGPKTDWEGQTVWLPFPGWAEDSARGDAVHAVPGKVAYTWEEEWKKNPIYACMHTHRRAHTQVSTMFSIVNATQICSMQTHVNTWIWSEVRRQSNTCTNTHANELYRGSVVCGNGPSSPAHILFPDLTSARLFRED